MVIGEKRMRTRTDSNDTRLILEALHWLLEAHDCTEPIADKIHARLAVKHSERVPRSMGNWVPSPDAFTIHTALLFCNSRTSKGFTADNMRKIGVPWPQPPRWKRRLTDCLADHFKLVKVGRIYKEPKPPTS